MPSSLCRSCAHPTHFWRESLRLWPKIAFLASFICESICGSRFEGTAMAEHWIQKAIEHPAH